jgi:peptidylprolyl isomerase domain and WD repeat-containing protein 1
MSDEDAVGPPRPAPIAEEEGEDVGPPRPASLKRPLEDSDEVGPPRPDSLSAPTKRQKRKKRRLPFERVYLDALPVASNYEKSYMHRDAVSHIVVTPRTDFVVTGR